MSDVTDQPGAGAEDRRLTIHHLEVQFDVASGGDEEVFGRLFQQHITRWQRLAAETRWRAELSERDRCLQDRDQEAG